MGKKLGNALIIYGIINFLVSFAFGNAIIIIGALIWMIILIALGNWQRSKARAEESRDKQTELLQRMEQRLSEKEKADLK
jgi:cytochrome oxidase assembly protein ShyY1